MVTLLFLPKGGLARTISYSPCLPASASLVTTGRFRPVRSSPADAVQQQVHRAEPRHAVDQLDAEERAALELLLLRPVERDGAWRCNRAPRAGTARAAGRIADRHRVPARRLRGDHVHHRGDERARGEVLARAAFHVLGVLLQQPLVGVALHVGGKADHCSLSIRSTMSRRSLAGSWILFCALRKMTPSMPERLPSSSSVWR